METIPFTALRVHVCQPDGEWLWLPVDQSPYYLTLANMDRQVFEDYHVLLRRYSPHTYEDEMGLASLRALEDSIRYEGFDFDREPRMWTQNEVEVRDGQHRLACLLAITPAFADGEVMLNDDSQIVDITLPDPNTNRLDVETQEHE